MAGHRKKRRIVFVAVADAADAIAELDRRREIAAVAFPSAGNTQKVLSPRFFRVFRTVR
jgi:hypothetical protein